MRLPHPQPREDTDKFNEAQRSWPKQLLLRDARTGKAGPAFTYQNPGEGWATFEPDGSLLFPAFQDSRAALVRCTPTGTCELATRPKQADGDVAADYLLSVFP